jgi:hypothetical protein
VGISPAWGFAEHREKTKCPQILYPCTSATDRWSVPESAPDFDPWAVAPQQSGNTVQQRSPLLPYDDMGNAIYRAEIEERMRSGGSGAAVGGLVGFLVGGGLGMALGFSICPMEILGPGCSPRDAAYRTVAIISGIAWGTATGALLGNEIGEIDTWKALEKIRAERRRAQASGGYQ